MRIVNSNVAMSSQHQLTESYSKQESLRFWQGNRRVEQQNQDPNQSLRTELTADRLEISQQAMKALQKEQLQTAVSTGASSAPQIDGKSVAEFKLTGKEERNLLILKKFLKALTGKDFDIRLPDGTLLQDDTASGTGMRIEHQLGGEKAPAPPQRQGWGLSYDLHEVYRETEQLSFSAAGYVQTADGRRIDFGVQLNMSREFVQTNNIRIREGDAKLTDPLVINFGGATAELTEEKIEFDLNADGQVEQMPFLKAGSGFLALDINRDGLVNDGKELFGVATGNGFEELAAYDEDQNGWIDENDAVYDQLRIWSKDAEGQDRLVGLKTADVGAIGLTHADASFSLKNADNGLLGQSRSAGVFLKDNGGAGTVQQVDLVV